MTFTTTELTPIQRQQELRQVLSLLTQLPVKQEFCFCLMNM